MLTAVRYGKLLRIRQADLATFGEVLNQRAPTSSEDASPHARAGWRGVGVRSIPPAPGLDCGLLYEFPSEWQPLAATDDLIIGAGEGDLIAGAGIAISRPAA